MVKKIASCATHPLDIVI